ncbi:MULTISPECIES: guanine deaminase [unclassified Ensifer]|uniref:guanine deaminase n=1 Tax=unclassified Ensifer TaxID=2633371 RepID=UPI00070D9DBA|nr:MULTISPECIES: guanine deaminase [unclassified Ensifer]KQU72555.1 guanine deaminase [Ensifer sp. Root31]MBD9488776.1 guanine deaminase [Ensifer sp. ENS11]OMQ45340.1 guanine deaminase [Ensifer sp. 1H6]PSS64844.1 guanine deaminase [Ensifer sp. NM-2]
MTDLLIRGRVLTFVEAPKGIDDHASYRYFEDGAVLVRNGKIADIGEHSDVARRAGPAVKVADHRPNLVLPGLIDTHLHFPQTQAIASYGAQLLEWLNTYIFVEEQKFRQPEHAQFIAGRFMDELLSNGTTTAVAYCSVHPESVDAYFGAAESRGMLMIGGKVMMDRNAPDALRDTPQLGYDETKQLIGKWHGRGRAHYAISPRFAITSTPEQMEMSRALVAEHPECYVQTHLSENKDEIAFATSLYPEAKDYTDIYARYDLLTRKTLLGHCIYLSDREISVLAETGAVGTFCPTSNLFLGSGLFDRDRFDKLGARWSVATDVGAGTSFSMLETMDEAYKVLHLQGQRLSPFNSFYMMTLGNARALDLDDRIGSLHIGADADIVVLDSRAKPSMELRMRVAKTLAEELFILQTMGDDRSVAETYVAGKPMKHLASNQAAETEATGGRKFETV